MSRLCTGVQRSTQAVIKLTCKAVERRFWVCTENESQMRQGIKHRSNSQLLPTCFHAFNLHSIFTQCAEKVPGSLTASRAAQASRDNVACKTAELALAEILQDSADRYRFPIFYLSFVPLGFTLILHFAALFSRCTLEHPPIESFD